MTKGLEIPHDLENKPIEVKTNTADGKLALYFKNSIGSSAGGFFINVKVSQYSLNICTSTYKNFPLAVPSEQSKIWRIVKQPGPRLVVHCNDKLVLDFKFSSSECTDTSWNKNWNRNVAKVQFSEGPLDTASESYRLYIGKLSLPELQF